MFEPREYETEEEQDDGVDRSSCNPNNSSINQTQFDAYQQLQQRATETLRAFTTQPIVSQPANRRGAIPANAGAGPAQGDGGEEYVALDEIYATVYNRDMDRRWANEPPLVFDMEDDDGGDGGDTSEHEEDGDQWEGSDGAPPRRNLFGLPQPDVAIDVSEQETPGKRARLRPDDNPRRRKRPCVGSQHPEPPQAYDTRQRPECFLCAWGNALHDGIEAPHVNKMTDIIQQNYGVHHNKEIANEVVLYYMSEVYDPALGMAPLTRQVVLEHLEQHTLDARIFLGEAIKAEKQMAFLFKNRMWRADGSFDKAAVIEYRHSMSALCGYYKMRLDTMNFNNGNNAEDMKKQANYMNLMMPRFDQRAPSGGGTPARARRREKTSVPVSRKQFV